MIDTIIIGAGPCGITAALYLNNFGYKVLLIYKDSGSLDERFMVHNYYGVQNQNGLELFNEGLNQASSAGIKVIKAEVLEISGEFGNFQVKTKDQDYEAETIVLATGRSTSKLRIKGYNQFMGKGISMCVMCDGFLYRKKKVALIGSKDFMKHELDLLSRFTKDIIILTNGESIEGLDYPYDDGLIQEFIGQDKLTSIQTSKQTHQVDAAFLAIGSKNSLEFAKELGIILDENKIDVNENMETNVTGIYAGGDSIKGTMQVIKAAKDGLDIALAIKEKLSQSKE